MKRKLTCQHFVKIVLGAAAFAAFVSAAPPISARSGQDPVLTVEPIPLSSVQAVGQVVTQTLLIGNQGGVPLTWELAEYDQHALPQGGQIWDQPVSGPAGNLSDYFIPLNGGVYSADDFKLTSPASIKVIRTDGYWTGGDLADAAKISWYIYPDAAGKPAGHPEDGLNLQVWAFAGAPTADGITVDGDTVTIDLVTAAGDPLDLDPGTYWLTVFPIIDSASLDEAARWNWSEADQKLAPAHVIDPQDLLGAGLTTWKPFASQGLAIAGTAFQLLGSTFECAASDIPWLSFPISAGTVDPGTTQEVAVLFDSTGLQNGTYFSTLCLTSNDPVAPIFLIPVDMEAVDYPEILLTPGSIDLAVAPGTNVETVLTLENQGISTLNWSIFEQSQAMMPGFEAWSEDFDSYPPGSNLHGQGGWKGWGGNSFAAAFTTDAQARSAPAALEISLDADLVHEFGFTSGKLVFSAWQYIPSSFSGATFFNLLNSYDEDDFTATNFSTMVAFMSGTGMVVNFGPGGGALPYVTDEWIQLRAEIDLSTNNQSFFYNDQLLFNSTWTEGVNGGGDLAFVGVDLFAFGSSPVFYDDLSLSGACTAVEDAAWLSISPAAGSTGAGETDQIAVSIDTAGLQTGESYAAGVCVTSNAANSPLAFVPVEITVQNYLGFLPIIWRAP